MTRPVRMEAAKRGDNTYDGSPCRVCGTTKKYTLNASCVECANERAKISMRKQRAKVKELMSQAREGA